MDKLARTCNAIGSKSDCRSRVHEFDPDPILSWRFMVMVILLLLIQEGVVVSYKRKYVHKGRLNDAKMLINDWSLNYDL